MHNCTSFRERVVAATWRNGILLKRAKSRFGCGVALCISPDYSTGCVVFTPPLQFTQSDTTSYRQIPPGHLRSRCTRFIGIRTVSCGLLILCPTPTAHSIICRRSQMNHAGAQNSHSEAHSLRPRAQNKRRRRRRRAGLPMIRPCRRRRRSRSYFRVLAVRSPAQIYATCGTKDTHPHPLAVRRCTSPPDLARSAGSARSGRSGQAHTFRNRSLSCAA